MQAVLTPESVKRRLAQEASQVESWLRTCLHSTSMPSGLQQAMYYSLLAGGKRLRPVLCLVCARLLGAAPHTILPFAGAIECIHTYSLIHDDLPAMDNDDLRRGKASNHKQFDEATAILAGDALLTDAFVFMASLQDIPATRLLEAIGLIAQKAGAQGMVAGQFLDMQYAERTDVSLEELAYMHALKTGALLEGACVSGALLAGGSSAEVAAIAQYGRSFGAAFQIMDDILDITGTEEELGKPVGSDEKENKSTYPSLLGIEKSKALALEHAQQAIGALKIFTGADAEFLQGLAQYVIQRVS